MFKLNTEMEAIPVTAPEIRTVFNPNTMEEDTHLGYEAEIQYKRKPPATRLILCGRLDTVNVGEPVMISYHMGMKCYQHARHLVISNDENCIGGFYFTDGTKAWKNLLKTGCKTNKMIVKTSGISLMILTMTKRLSGSFLISILKLFTST